MITCQTIACRTGHHGLCLYGHNCTCICHRSFTRTNQGATPMNRAQPTIPAGALVERFPITLGDGRVWEGSLHRTSRPSGRRILVRDQAGAGRLLFDTDDCHDQANACNRLEWWLATVAPIPPALAARFAGGWVPDGPSPEAVYFRRWAKEQASVAFDLPASVGESALAAARKRLAEHDANKPETVVALIAER